MWFEHERIGELAKKKGGYWRWNFQVGSDSRMVSRYREEGGCLGGVRPGREVRENRGMDGGANGSADALGEVPSQQATL